MVKSIIRIDDLEALLTDDDLNRSIIDLDDFIGAACAYGEELEKLSEPQRKFYLNQNLEREINNGGFEQYFINSTGDHALETVDSLMEIGARKTAQLLLKAIDLFPNSNVPKDREERLRLIGEHFSGRAIWDELDDQFFRYEDDLNTLNIEFVRAHRDEF